MKKFFTLLVLMAGCVLGAQSIKAEGIYASLSSDGKTLTLYYGEKRNAEDSDQWWNQWNTSKGYSVQNAILEESMKQARPTTTQKWFNDFKQLETVSYLTFLNTSEVTDMSAMFQSCKALKSVNLTRFDTKKVQNLSHMFNGCESLQTVNISGFDTQALLSTSYMFQNCKALKSIYCEKDWSQVANSKDMFNNCFELEGENGTKYITVVETTASYARLDKEGTPGYFSTVPPEIYAVLSTDGKTMTLYYDNQLIPKGGSTTWSSYGSTAETVVFDKSMQNARPTSTQAWFFNFSNLKSITNLCYLNTEEVTIMRAMFTRCDELEEIDLSHFNTGKVTTMAYMFMECHALKSINVNSFDISNVTSMGSMFKDCSGLKTIYCDGNWSGTTASQSGMFDGCVNLVGEKGTVYNENYTNAAYAHPDEGNTNPGYFTHAPKVYTEFVESTESTGTLTYYYDNKMNSRTGTTVIYDPKSNAIRYSTYCEKIVTAVLDESMKDAPLSSTKFMFSCGRTPYYTLKNLTKIQHMEYLNTSRVTDMTYMFAMCRSLESIDLSEFNTSNVTTMEGMFGECNALKSLNLNSFDVSDVQNVYQMFYNCTALTTIYCDSNWYDITPLAKSDKMFIGCTKLVGENGTACDGTNNLDITYARPDKPANNEPGYFTIEPAEIYATVNGTTLTIRYDKLRKRFGGVTDWSAYRKTIETVVFKELMQFARPTSTSRWFKDFESLTKIEHLEYLNTSEVTDMSGMFSGVSSLQSLDVSTFDIRNVTDMSRMFEYCVSLKAIYCDRSWSTTTAVSDEMFKRCVAIVGGNGTTYKATNPDDATYARPDGGTGNEGYFTKDKPTSIDKVQNDQVPSTKVLRDGQLFIIRGDKTYTLTGQKVK